MARTNTPSLDGSAFPSSLGWMALACRDGLVEWLTFGHLDPQAALQSLPVPVADPRSDSRFAWLERRLQAMADGADDDFLDVKIQEGHLTAFQRSVVYHCRRIPRGSTISYRELATRAGSPGAARAVGNVMRANRFPLVVPCHRVVGSGGGLGGYSAPDGLRMKRRLLALESATVPS